MKDCMTCLYVGTHEHCWKSDKHPADCLGSPQEVEANNGQYLYLCYVEGDGMERRIQWENDGKCNIVIGGQGEAEVNTKWTPEETVKHLCYVAEQCGYLCSKGLWGGFFKEVHITTTEGYFILEYYQDKLTVIKKRTERVMRSF